MNAIDMANSVSNSTRAADAGVVVTVLLGPDQEFSIWSIGRNGNINEHRLNVSCTDLARLTAHVQGFIENHKKAWA